MTAARGMMSLNVWSHVPSGWGGGVFVQRGDFPTVLTPSDGHCSGRYASYWNALLLLLLRIQSVKSTRKLQLEYKKLFYCAKISNL